MFRTILVGTDGSPTAPIAVDEAGELAKAPGASVHVVPVHAGVVRPEEDLTDRQHAPRGVVVSRTT